MRPTHNAVWIDDDGEFLGINLGADFCAEHEWGIGGLKRYFGIDDTKMGIQKRAVTKLDEDRLHLSVGTKYGYLLFDSSIQYYKGTELPKYMDRALPKYYIKEETGIMGSWDDGSFGIRVKGKENCKKLQDLHKAIFHKDVVIMLGKFSDNPFENAGLMILIKSKLPKSFTDAAMEADIDAKKLEEADMATGIKAKLESVGKRWMALSPRWKSEDRKSAHPVMYWLNPYDQRDNHYGWYTVEDLELWAENKGPVIENSDTYKEGRHPVQRGA